MLAVRLVQTSPARMTAPRDRSPLPPTPPYGAPAAPAAPAPVRAPARPRRNPARGAKAVALASSIAATLGLAGVLERTDDADPSPRVSAASSGTTAAAPTTRRNASGLADGVYAGTAQPTKWGPIQVQATIRSGRIVSVVEVLAPSDRKSIRINGQAAPILESEAIATQSADLDAVSGATWTSRTYTASLQAALDQARAASGTAS
jgi:uncharacterized protein with FMN-binding domain